jgi:Competence protein CoiA-like family
MYKAIHAETGEEIIILSPYWHKRIELLRAMDHTGCLVCQGCRQPLRVKAGGVKRPHFAHKHLKACSYGSESPEILNARAVLYGWLVKQFGSHRNTTISLEMQIDGLTLPRPVDCWVETGFGVFAYWIIEAGIKLEPREAIRAAFEEAEIRVHYVFLQSMLNEQKKELHSLFLTPTERVFMQPTGYDQTGALQLEPGKSLHYLDADRAILITYRSLMLFHAPNWYRGLKKTDSLAVVRASPADGEFVHPGEADRLSALREKQRRLEEKRVKYQAREAAWESRLAARSQNHPTVPTEREAEIQGHPAAGALPCVICGQVTTDYWSTFTDETGRRLCRCRECLDRGA